MTTQAPAALLRRMFDAAIASAQPALCVPPHLPKPEELPEGGFGWYLIQDLTQELCYYREDRRNFLAFRIPLMRDAG